MIKGVTIQCLSIFVMTFSEQKTCEQTRFWTIDVAIALSPSRNFMLLNSISFIWVSVFKTYITTQVALLRRLSKNRTFTSTVFDDSWGVHQILCNIILFILLSLEFRFSFAFHHFNCLSKFLFTCLLFRKCQDRNR